MFEAIGVERFEDLLEGVPEHLRMSGSIPLPDGVSEMELRARLEELACRNLSGVKHVCFAGCGAYDHFVPSAIDAVVSRSEYTTAYTPYQAEVSQGTLQVIYEFQSLIAELTGMDVANASLYDGAHALAEGMLMAHGLRKTDRVLVTAALNPHYRRVLDTYAEGMGIEVTTVPVGSDGRTDAAALEEALTEPAAALILAQPNVFGCLEDARALASLAHGADQKKPPLVIASIYPTSLGLLEPPGVWGADVAAGEGQSLGIPMSLGGPYLGLFAAKEEYLRRMPGRLIGRTVDQDGRSAFVMTLATREQHIRREKATSNICTNQGLFATWATVYMTLVGPKGLKEIAVRSAQTARYLAEQLSGIEGVSMTYPDSPFFNEFTLTLPGEPGPVLERLTDQGILGGVDITRFGEGLPGDLLVAVTERRTRAEMDHFTQALADAVS